MISGVLSYVVIFMIGLALMGYWGDPSAYVKVYGLVLVLILVWWVLRQLEIIPHF